MHPVDPSMSGLPRAMACAGAAVIPGIRRKHPSARRGIWIHRFLADCNQAGRAEALKRAPPELRDYLEALDLRRLPLDPDKYAVEVAFAYNWHTGDCIELGRGDAKVVYPDGCIGGRVDVVGIDGDSVLIIDYKSGFGDLGPLEHNWQLKAYALAACKAYGKRRARIAIVWVRDDRTWMEVAELTELDLYLAEKDIRRAMATIQQVRTAYVGGSDIRGWLREGDHCTHCPAYASCPAKASLASALARGDAVLPLMLTRENAAAAYRRAQDVIKLAEWVQRVVEGLAETEDIDLGDGKVLGMAAYGHEEINWQRAQGTITSRFGAGTFEQALTTTTELTKAKLTKAIKAWCADNPPAKHTPTMRSLLEQLRAEGAATTPDKRKVKVHTPKALPSASTKELPDARSADASEEGQVPQGAQEDEASQG